jgi:glycosidase
MGRAITLAEAPDSELERWQRLGFTHIWLMGVWTGGPRGREQALNNTDLSKAYSEALPGWTPEDVSSSPYAITEYRVAPALGGEAGIKNFRERLRVLGMKLILDFVPNHLGLDHPWVKERPELFAHSVNPEAGTFAEETAVAKTYLAYGKDPYFAPWTDTVQLDYRRAETRAVMSGLLQEVAGFCDGVRCDMAMLVLNDVFANTWKRFPTSESAPQQEFWSDAVGSTRRRYPGFLFLAEVYWGLEQRLQSLGFNYTYDKALYDLLLSRESGAVQRHLLGMSPEGLAGNAHFLENHDEPRIASILPKEAQRAAALVILGLPGMRFLHEGQLSGLRRRLPVQLARRAREPEDAEIRSMYDQLLGALRGSKVGQGNGQLLVPQQAWDSNPTGQHFVLVQWSDSGPNFQLVVVNLAPHQSQCFAPVKLPANAPVSWSVRDLLGEERFIRETEDLNRRGLYLDLPAHGAQILHFDAA